MRQWDRILHAAALAGKIMLESGAEISRVEQTVVHLSCALGVQGCEAFATPTAIVLSVTAEDGREVSCVRRITQRDTRLDRVEEVNTLSRLAVARGADIAVVESRLREIAGASSYSPALLLLARGVGAGAVAVFFGGGLAVCVCGFAGGVLLRGFLSLLARVQPNLFVKNLTGGAVAALCGLVCYLLGLTAGWQEVTTAVIMLMVPGVAITNALRDIAAGELVAGISRTVEAFCIAAALGCGTALVYAVAQALGGVVL